MLKAAALAERQRMIGEVTFMMMALVKGKDPKVQS
jgi:hypothetical protein